MTTSLPDHLFIGCDGSLHDTREATWASTPLRTKYRYTFAQISSSAELKATLRNGPYAWPGGYPMFFITEDGGALSFDSVRENLASILESMKHHYRDGWRVVACDVNWEDGELFCDHSGERIESAYGED